jgi:hypothetical protein
VRRLSMISTDVKGSPDTESFRLFFKVRTSSQPHLEISRHESIFVHWMRYSFDTMTEANDIQQTKYDYIISSAPLGKPRSTADILYNLALSSTIQHLISWRRSFGHTRHAYICSLPSPSEGA